MTTTTYTQLIQKFYVAYFNRPADVAGLAFWEGALTALNGDTKLINSAFSRSDEYIATYGNLSNQVVVNRVYQNLFGRDAESAGITFWGDALDRHLITIDDVVTQVAAGAQGSDLIAYNAKVMGASSFTSLLSTNPDYGSIYSGALAAGAAKSFTSTITDAESLAYATRSDNLTYAIGLLKSAQVPGLNLSLSTGTDNITPGSSRTLAGNDQFNADFTASSETLNPGDTLDGGSGANNLNISSTSSRALTYTNSIHVNNIQEVHISTLGTVSVDASQWQGLRRLVVGAEGSLTLNLPDDTNAITGTTLLGDNLSIDGGRNLNIAINHPIADSAIRIGANHTASGDVLLHLITPTLNQPVQVSGGKHIQIEQLFNTQPAVIDSLQNAAITVLGSALTQSVVIKNTVNNRFDALHVAQNDVLISDAQFAQSGQQGSISEVSISGYRDATIQSNALSKLSLANNTGALHIAAGLPASSARTLDISLQNIVGTIDLHNDYTNVNINSVLSRGETNEIRNFTDNTLRNLGISGEGELSLTGELSLPALSSITHTGSGLFTAALDQSNVSTISVSAGPSSLTLDGSKTTYQGGRGNDQLTYNASAVTKAVTLGAGLDLLDISKSTSLSARIDGGDDADALTISTDLLSRLTTGNGPDLISNFETIVLTGDMTGQTINLSRAGLVSSVFLSGENLNLTQVAEATDFSLTNAGKAFQISNSAFAKASNDSISLTLVNHGKDNVHFVPDGVTLSDVETVLIHTTGFDNTAGGGPDLNTLDLHGNAIVNITVLGYNGLELHCDNTTLTKVDFSDLVSGGSKFTAAALVHDATFIGVNQKNVVNTFDLSAARANINYTGGTGADLIKVNGLLNQVNVGSAGLDHVTISAAGANAATYTTISNAHAGLTLSLPGAISNFAADKIAPGNATVALTLANTFVHQSGNASTQAATGWFQLDGNTWIVQSRHDASASNSGFLDGTDVLVKLTGLIDLSHAQINANHDLVLV